MNSGPTLAIGSTGPDVRRLQILLVMIKLLDFSGIDGDFDDASAIQDPDPDPASRILAFAGPLSSKNVALTRPHRGLECAPQLDDHVS